MNEWTIIEFIREALSMAGIALVFIMSIVTGLMVEAVKRTEKVDNRYLPFLSLGIGFALATIAGLVFYGTGDLQLNQVALVSLSGFISGGLASGIYDNIRSILPKNE